MGNSPVLGAIYNPATVNTRPQVRSGRRRIVIDASGRGLYIGRPEWRDPHCSLPRVVCVRRAAARPTAHRPRPASRWCASSLRTSRRLPARTGLARPPCTRGLGLDGRGRQILCILALVTVYNPATPRRAPAALPQTVRNPITLGTAAAYTPDVVICLLGTSGDRPGSYRVQPTTVRKTIRCVPLHRMRRERRRSAAGYLQVRPPHDPPMRDAEVGRDLPQTLVVAKAWDDTVRDHKTLTKDDGNS